MKLFFYLQACHTVVQAPDERGYKTAGVRPGDKGAADTARVTSAGAVKPHLTSSAGGPE